MTATFKGEGKRIQWLNSTGASIASGTPVDLGGYFGIALLTIANGAKGVLLIDSEHVLTATTASTWAIGDDVYWDADNSALIEIGGTGYQFIGKAVRSKTASTETTNRFKLNAGAPISPELNNRTWETHSVDKVIDANDVGKVMNMVGLTKTYTLPATATGLVFICRNGNPDGNILTIDPNGSDKFLGNDLAPNDGVTYVNTAATAREGDFVILRAEGTHGYYVEAQRGIWAVGS